MSAKSGVEDAFVRHPLRLIGVAALFAASGALSPIGAQFVRLPHPIPWDSIALPFALLSAAFFLRSWKAVFSVLLNVAVWEGATALEQHISRQLEPGCYESFIGYTLAGAAGALGVALADSIACRRLFSLWPLATVTQLGAFSAAAACDPFGLIRRGDSSSPNYNWIVIVAAWQACVGTYLYWECAEGKRPEASLSVVR